MMRYQTLWFNSCWVLCFCNWNNTWTPFDPIFVRCSIYSVYFFLPLLRQDFSYYWSWGPIGSKCLKSFWELSVILILPVVSSFYLSVLSESSFAQRKRVKQNLTEYWVKPAKNFPRINSSVASLSGHSVLWTLPWLLGTPCLVSSAQENIQVLLEILFLGQTLKLSPGSKLEKTSNLPPWLPVFKDLYFALLPALHWPSLLCSVSQLF